MTKKEIEREVVRMNLVISHWTDIGGAAQAAVELSARIRADVVKQREILTDAIAKLKG